MTQNPFNTKFVADVGTLVVSSSDSVDAEMTVGGVTVLSERYSPANGEIVVRGLRNVLNDMFTQMGQDQLQIFQLMNQHGWYQLKPAQPQDIQTAKQKYQQMRGTI